jgi:hypothetical protein
MVLIYSSQLESKTLSSFLQYNLASQLFLKHAVSQSVADECQSDSIHLLKMVGKSHKMPRYKSCEVKLRAASLATTIF